MKSTLRALLLLTCFLYCASMSMPYAQTPGGPGAGVARELARTRAGLYSNIRYTISISVKPGAELLEGREQLVCEPSNPAVAVVLDWRKSKGAEVRDIQING